ncbi:MAG: hypothetical protein PVG98_01670 [Chromatiales bacterium]|jgi:nitrate/TMAO reductase-like tetraheme cytochrome c subunit
MTWLVGLFAGAGMPILLTDTVVEASSKDAFCLSCHELGIAYDRSTGTRFTR